MTSLLERLQAKRPRRATVNVRLGEPDEATLAEIASLQAGLMSARLAQDDTEASGHEAALAEADARSMVGVGFTAANPLAWEAVASQHPSQSGEDGGVDWHAALPLVAAICADDESLNDDEAWRALLATWSYGERLSLWRTLLDINLAAPPATLPKD